ncbi:MAG: slipin family protein [Anaerolineae bacterium]|nr:slipin family protein [Anaerolineae bacterium]
MNAGLTLTALGLRREVTVWEYERGLLYKDGRFVRLLEPGRYRFWRWEKVSVVRVSLRQMSQVISGQAMLTADRIEVRVSLVVQYTVADPALAVGAVESYTDRLYQDLQLSLRDLVAGYEVDQFLGARAELGEALLAEIAPRAQQYGVTVERAGVRDVVLPGSVRDVFMKEVEADREGRASLVRARHEVAAARARANTAKILAENPNVVRLQEIDALVKLAGGHGSVVLLPNLADLLAPGSHHRDAEGG